MEPSEQVDCSGRQPRSGGGEGHCVGQAPRAQVAAEAGSGHRVHRPAIGQHAVHGHRPDHPGLPPLRRSLGRPTRREHHLERSAPPEGPPRPGPSHRSSLRLQGHRSAHGEPLLGGAHRQDRIRHADDGRSLHNVSLHSSLRLWW